MAMVRKFYLAFPLPSEGAKSRSTGAGRMCDDTEMSHRHTYVPRINVSGFYVKINKYGGCMKLLRLCTTH